MAEMSNYLENALINATLRNTSYTSPATVYLALYTSDPTDADSGTEVSGTPMSVKQSRLAHHRTALAQTVRLLSFLKPLALGALWPTSAFVILLLLATCFSILHWMRLKQSLLVTFSVLPLVL